MRKILFGIIVAATITPVWAAAHGAGGSGHGAAVSAAAQNARLGSSPVGPSVRDVARTQSQGATHANANAISHVQNSPGMANTNSVLGNGGATTATSAQMTTGTQAQTPTRVSAKSGKANKSKTRIH